jgi:hypothetical protein
VKIVNPDSTRQSACVLYAWVSSLNKHRCFDTIDIEADFMSQSRLKMTSRML